MKFCNILIATTALLLPCLAFAHNVHIEEPEIYAGKFDLHNIAVGNFDENDSFSNEAEISYGFNDWFMGKLAHVGGKREGQNFDYYTGGETAVQFELTSQEGYFPASALYLSYDWHSQSPVAPNVNVMGIFRERIGAFNNLLNLKLSHNVGENAQGGVRLGIAARSAYEINHHLAFGIEYFSRLGQLDNMPSFDEQSHQVGPVILLTPFEDVHMHSSLGYLLGISDSATDGAVKFEIGFEF